MQWKGGKNQVCQQMTRQVAVARKNQFQVTGQSHLYKTIRDAIFPALLYFQATSGYYNWWTKMQIGRQNIKVLCQL